MYIKLNITLTKGIFKQAVYNRDYVREHGSTLTAEQRKKYIPCFLKLAIKDIFPDAFIGYDYIVPFITPKIAEYINRNNLETLYSEAVQTKNIINFPNSQGLLNRLIHTFPDAPTEEVEEAIENYPDDKTICFDVHEDIFWKLNPYKIRPVVEHHPNLEFLIIWD